MFTVELAANPHFTINDLAAVRTLIAGLLLGQGEVHADALAAARAWTEELGESGLIEYDLDAGRLAVATMHETFHDTTDADNVL